MELQRARVLHRLQAIEKVLGAMENMLLMSEIAGWSALKGAMGELRDEIRKAESDEAD